ncbi:MAG: response regulator [Aquihabitans sp.]
MTYILLADDDPDIREIVSFKLSQTSLDVRSFADGESALAEARRDKPLVAVLDVLMPKLDGLAVCRAFRADPELATVPVLLLTARAMDKDVELGFDVGATDYLTKPFSPRELLVRVQAMLRRADPGGA